ncbi:hypothetical protein ACP3W2_28265, partial [Salmonella enterica]|uniref:hypothetical protein n=1 Tax=Salmonella enterica TaxID=28901 RepID=UPI003CE88AA7
SLCAQNAQYYTLTFSTFTEFIFSANISPNVFSGKLEHLKAYLLPHQVQRNCIAGTYDTEEKREPSCFQNFGIN